MDLSNRLRGPDILAAIVVSLAMGLLGCQPQGTSSDSPLSATSETAKPTRAVVGNLLESASVPEIAILVDSSFAFVGGFGIEIEANSDEWPDDLIGKPIAAGERFVFVDARENGLVERLFIVQFEGFLDNNEETYNYNFAAAEQLGENRYRHNTWFYNSRDQAEKNPKGEGARTRAFLSEQDFQVADEYMMSRFVGLASEDRRNEIIIYYVEMMRSSTGYTLEQWESESVELGRAAIEEEFVARSRKSFEIVRG